MIVAKNDEMEGADPKMTVKVFNLIDHPKERVNISGGRFGLLNYPSRLFEKSSKTQINFLKRQLDEKP